MPKKEYKWYKTSSRDLRLLIACVVFIVVITLIFRHSLMQLEIWQRLVYMLATGLFGIFVCTINIKSVIRHTAEILNKLKLGLLRGRGKK